MKRIDIALENAAWAYEIPVRQMGDIRTAETSRKSYHPSSWYCLSTDQVTQLGNCLISHLRVGNQWVNHVTTDDLRLLRLRTPRKEAYTAVVADFQASQ